MPMKSKLVIAAFVALFLLTAATLLCSVAWAGGVFWGLTSMSVLIAALALLALDGFHPRVNLFIPAIVSLPQRAQRKTIALPFDDGPVPLYTQKIPIGRASGRERQ